MADADDESLQQFLDFDWSHEGWQSYVEGLYPAPNAKQMLKFKKKWYKKKIDSEFDDSWEPPAPPGEEKAANDGGGGQSSSAQSAFPGASYTDGTRWAVMGPKSTICFVAYALAMIIAIGAVAGVFPPWQALWVLVGAFLLEILSKYGLKLNATYLHALLLDDVGAMPIMAVTLLMPGLHPYVRTMALSSPFITALLSFSQICKFYGKLSPTIHDFFAPLAEPSARHQVMQFRSHLEVGLGFILISGVFGAFAAPVSGIFYWNFMMMRYMLSPWTQHSFRKIDTTVGPAVGKIPGIRNIYGAIKRGLFSFVDPDKKGGKGGFCTIL